MLPADAAPKLAHATGDTVRIVVQFLRILQSHQLALPFPAKTFKVEFLTTGDDSQHLSDKVSVARAEPGQNEQHIWNALKEHSFRSRGLCSLAARTGCPFLNPLFRF